MKILLTLIMCSYVQGACLQPYEWPIQFNDMYDCFQAGYEESQKKMTEELRSINTKFILGLPVYPYQLLNILLFIITLIVSVHVLL